MTRQLQTAFASRLRPEQVSEQLQSATKRIAAVCLILRDLSSNAALGEGAAQLAVSIADKLERDDSCLLIRLQVCIAELDSQIAADSWLAVAAVTQCKALAAGIQLDFRSAADHCASARQINSLPAMRQWEFSRLAAAFTMEQGRVFGEDATLQAAIALIRSHVMPLAEATGDAVARATSNGLLAEALAVIGLRKRGVRYLEESIAAFRQALRLYTGDPHHGEMSLIHNHLANALGALGQRLGDDDLLKESLEQFDQALTCADADNAPMICASIMNNRAAMLLHLGMKNQDAKMLKQAVESYKDVLQIWTRARLPFEWATTMNSLGTVLRALGEQRRGARTLRQSVAAFESALTERTQTEYPEQWALTNNNMGAALQKLAQREDSAETMQRATEAYENALVQWTQDKVPMTWAMTMANLSVARRELAEITADLETANQAVMEVQLAVEVFRSASHAQYTELGEEQLAKSRQLVAALTVKDG